MGHLTVMKSTGARWQIHLEPWREGERERERQKGGVGWRETDRLEAIARQLGRKGRQWHNTWFSNKKTVLLQKPAEEKAET